MAAARGVMSKGLCRWVRHPMYEGYLLSHIGYLLLAPSLWNALVYAAVWGFLGARIFAEERMLFEDPAYAEYAEKVPWRLLPLCLLTDTHTPLGWIRPPFAIVGIRPKSAPEGADGSVVQSFATAKMTPKKRGVRPTETGAARSRSVGIVWIADPVTHNEGGEIHEARLSRGRCRGRNWRAGGTPLCSRGLPRGSLSA